MLLAFLLLTVIGAFIYHFRTVPGLCAEIAQRKGLDERKWYLNGLVFGGIALLYLRSSLLPTDTDLKKRINRELVIEIGFVIWFVTMALVIEARGHSA